MLLLLDPDVSRLDDLIGFRQRVQTRLELGTTFFTFVPSAPAFLLREKVVSLRTMFPSDAPLEALLTQIDSAMDESRSADVAEAVAAARTHISETYRLHRRLLRTRRTGELLTTFPVHGRERPQQIWRLSHDEDVAQRWLDDWRDFPSARVQDFS